MANPRRPQIAQRQQHAKAIRVGHCPGIDDEGRWTRRAHSAGDELPHLLDNFSFGRAALGSVPTEFYLWHARRGANE